METRLRVGIGIYFITVKVLKEGWKAWAEVETKATGIALIVLAPQLFIESILIPIFRFVPFDCNEGEIALFEHIEDAGCQMPDRMSDVRCWSPFLASDI